MSSESTLLYAIDSRDPPRVWTGIAYGNYSSWKFTERSKENCDRVVAVTSSQAEFSDQTLRIKKQKGRKEVLTSVAAAKIGEFTISGSNYSYEIISEVVRDDLPIFRRWKTQKFLLHRGNEVVAEATRASRQGKNDVFLLESDNSLYCMKNKSYILRLGNPSREYIQTVYAIEIFNTSDDSERNNPEKWNEKTGHKVCEIKWNPLGRKSVRKETLTWGYEVVMKHGEDEKIVIFALFILKLGTSGATPKLNESIYINALP